MKTPQFRIAKPAAAPLRLALELRAGKIIAGLIDDGGRITASRQAENQGASVRSTSVAISKLLVDLSSAPERDEREISAIGICVPGYVDPDDARVTLPGQSSWLNVSLRDLVSRELASSGVDLRLPQSAHEQRAESRDASHPPITISSRPAALVAAEVWIGAARGATNVVYLDIGDQIEAGLLVDGRILHGASGRAGAIGWFALSENYREEFAARGCFAAEAGRASILRRVIEAASGDGSSLLERLSAADATQLSPMMVLRAARAGDQLARRVVADLCNWIGRGTADLISALNPEVVAIGGELGSALKPFYGELRREVRRWAQPSSGRQCRIVPTSLGSEAALAGAARLAAPEIKETGKAEIASR